MAVEHQQFDVFLSYSRKDERFVDGLASALVTKELSVWRDIQNLRATARWLEEIQAAIDASSMFAVVLTQNYLASDACRVELGLALKSGKIIAPLLCEQGLTLPPPIAEVQWIPFYDQTRFYDSVQKLVDAVDADPAARSAHTWLLVRGTEWKESRIDDSLLRGAELARAEEWLKRWESDAATPDVLRVVKAQRDFVDASRAAADRARRSRAILRSVVAVILAIAALFAGWQTLNVRTRARQQHAARLATDATRTDDVELGLLMATDSLLEWPTAEADAFVRSHLLLVPQQLAAVKLATDALSAAFAADDSRLYLVPANEQQEAKVEVWTWRDGRRQPLSEHAMRVIAAPRGPLVAVVRSDQRVDIIDGTTGVLKRSLEHSRNVTSAAFSNNVKYIATGSWDGRVRIWEVDSKAGPIAELARDGAINDVAFMGPKRVAVISAAPDFTVWTWDPRFAQAKPIVQPLGSVPVLLAASGHSALVATDSGEFHVYDRGLRPYRSDIAKPTAVAILQKPSGTRIAVGGQDGLVAVQGMILRHPAPVKSIAFSSDGDRILTAAGNAAYVWDQSSQLVLKMAQPGIAFAQFSPGSHRIVTAGADGSVRMWSDRPRFRPRSIKVNERIARLHYLPNGHLATVVQDPNVRFNADESVIIKARARTAPPVKLPPHEALAFGENGEIAIAHVRDVTLLDERLRPKATIRFPFEVRELAFSSDNSLIAASGNDRNAAVHDLAERRTSMFAPLTASATSIAFTDTRTIALSELDRVSLYDAKGRRRGSADHLFAAMRIVASRDRKLLAIAGGDSTTRIRTANRLRLRAELPHTALVHDLAFNDDGTRLATSADDGFVRIWDMAEARELARFPRSGEQNAVAFSPDGRSLAFAKSADTIEIWPWRPADLRDEVCRSVSRPFPRKTCMALPTPLAMR
jgi:WD40 repeat protein